MNNIRCLAIAIIAVATVMFLASSCSAPANNEPIISSLEPATQEIVPLGSLDVVCAASDTDGDDLIYVWSASAGEISGGGTTATWTAPASEGSYGVTVVVTDGQGGQATDSVTITVRANNPPTITGLTTDAEWTTPSRTVQVACAASDPDGELLSYDWTATAGDISGSGAVVNWTAPQEVGTYSITVVVMDGYGGEATRSTSVNVVPPLTIESFIVTPEGNIYLTEITPGYEYMVLRSREYYIECSASGPGGGLVYEWSCDHGQISGGGSMITWAAPSTNVELTATVTVVVSDGAGDSITENLVFQVATCACAF